MSATGFERQRRYDLSKSIAATLQGKDKNKFIATEGLECSEGTLEIYLITKSRGVLEKLLIKAEAFPTKKRKRNGTHGS